MRIIINNASQQPIYEQIVDQVKSLIIDGELQEHQILPSVRALSKELKISALTVKKAYDNLEQEGFIVTVHGKGSFVASTNQELLNGRAPQGGRSRFRTGHSEGQTLRNECGGDP